MWRHDEGRQDCNNPLNSNKHFMSNNKLLFGFHLAWVISCTWTDSRLWYEITRSLFVQGFILVTVGLIMQPWLLSSIATWWKTCIRNEMLTDFSKQVTYSKEHVFTSANFTLWDRYVRHLCVRYSIIFCPPLSMISSNDAISLGLSKISLILLNSSVEAMECLLLCVYLYHKITCLAKNISNAWCNLLLYKFLFKTRIQLKFYMNSKNTKIRDFTGYKKKVSPM